MVDAPILRESRISRRMNKSFSISVIETLSRGIFNTGSVEKFSSLRVGEDARCRSSFPAIMNPHDRFLDDGREFLLQTFLTIHSKCCTLFHGGKSFRRVTILPPIFLPSFPRLFFLLYTDIG